MSLPALATTTTATVSLLPKLEPLAGIALAVNLAYLNLKRWRYRDEIRDGAIAALAKLEIQQANNNGVANSLSQYKGLIVLAGRGQDQKPVRLPAFVQIFEILFASEIDIKISFALAAFSTFILCSGVAADIEYWKFLTPYADKAHCIFYFYCLLVSLFLPIIVILTGRDLVVRSKSYAQECHDELANLFEGMVATAQAPPPGN